MTDTTTPAPQAGDTERAYAVRLGLAKATRGRYGKEALAAIDAAKAAGFVFAEPVKATPTPKAAVTNAADAAPVERKVATPKVDTTGLDPKEVRAWAKAEGIEVAERGRLNSTVVSAYVKANGRPVGPRARRVTPLDMPKVRRENTGFTVAPGGAIVSQSICGSRACGNPVSRCSCKGGPVSFPIDGVVSPLSLVRPSL